MQAVVFKHQSVTHHHAGHAGVFLAELQHHRHEAATSYSGISLAFGNLVNKGKNALLDELDQAFKHLRLAGEVAIKRGLAHLQPGGQGRRGDALGTGLLQHGGQGLQNLHAALAGLEPFARGAQVS